MVGIYLYKYVAGAIPFVYIFYPLVRWNGEMGIRIHIPVYIKNVLFMHSLRFKTIATLKTVLFYAGSACVYT